MKHLATMTLMLSLGVAGVYAQQTHVNMTVSGTNAPSTVNLQVGSGTSEYNLAGKGTLGQFTFRLVSASAASPEQSSTCTGLYIPTLAGKGVFRFQDGSLLKVKLTGGSDCIDLMTQSALCTRILQIIGGTGRFRDASGGTITLTETVVPVVPNEFDLFAVTGEITGKISGVNIDEAPQDEHP
jgi:ethanolamine utilization protein EutA (predicted chaperonin)